MKTIQSFCLALTLLAFISVFPVRGQTDVLAYAKSPDHPSTWVAGAFNIHQALRWDPSKQLLFADVKYSTQDFADSAHPPQEDDYSLAFPAVRLNPESNTFVAHGVSIGTLHHGILGSHVALHQGVALDVHRHHGRIYAAIVPDLDRYSSER